MLHTWAELIFQLKSVLLRFLKHALGDWDVPRCAQNLFNCVLMEVVLLLTFLVFEVLRFTHAHLAHVHVYSVCLAIRIARIRCLCVCVWRLCLA